MCLEVIVYCLSEKEKKKKKVPRFGNFSLYKGSNERTIGPAWIFPNSLINKVDIVELGFKPELDSAAKLLLPYRTHTKILVISDTYAVLSYGKIPIFS